MRATLAVLPLALGLGIIGCKKKEEAQPVPLPEAEKVSQAAPLEAEPTAADAPVPERKVVAGNPTPSRNRPGAKKPAPHREVAQANPGVEAPTQPAPAAVVAPVAHADAAVLDQALPSGAVVVEANPAALGLAAAPAPDDGAAGVMPGGGAGPAAGGRYTAADLRPLAPRGPVGAPPGPEPTFDEGLDAPQPPVRPTPVRPQRGPVVRQGMPAATPPGLGAAGEQPLPAAAPDAGVPVPGEAQMPPQAPGRLPHVVRPDGEAHPAVVLPTATKPNAAIYLREEDVLEALGAKRPLDVHELPGVAGDDRYDALYFGSPAGDQYYAGLQIWRPRSPIDAQRRYTQMVRSYPNAEETTAVGSKTFFAFWNDLYYLVFLLSDNAAPTVVALTCDQRTCDTPQELVTLASKIYDRLNAKEPTP